MTYEQITSLLDRGFTPDQITALARADPSQEEPIHEPEEPRPEGPEQQEPEQQEPEPENNQFAQIKAELDSLKQSIQKNNVLTKSFEKVDESNTVEDILAGFIRPPMNGGKK